MLLVRDSGCERARVCFAALSSRRTRSQLFKKPEFVWCCASVCSAAPPWYVCFTASPLTHGVEQSRRPFLADHSSGFLGRFSPSATPLRLGGGMSEKKRFRLGPAVVNICAMKPELAEVVINIANSALRCVQLVRREVGRRKGAERLTPWPRPAPTHCRDNVTEQEAAKEIKGKLKEKYADGLWQVGAGRQRSSLPPHGARSRPRPRPHHPPIGLHRPEPRVLRHLRGGEVHLLLHRTDRLLHLRGVGSVHCAMLCVPHSCAL